MTKTKRKAGIEATVERGTRTDVASRLVELAGREKPPMLPPWRPYYYGERPSGRSPSVAYVDIRAGRTPNPDAGKERVIKSRLFGAHTETQGEYIFPADYWAGPLPRHPEVGRDAYWWGEDRVGTVNLAASILAHATGDSARALELAGDFAGEVLARIERDRWALPKDDVLAWVEAEPGS